MSAALQLKALSHAYAEQTVLRGIDLSIQSGEFVALIGPNGSGKTTLLRCLAGIVTPQSGTVQICGIDVARDPYTAKQHLGFAVEPTLLPGLLSGRQTLAMFASARGLAQIPESSLELAESLAFTAWLDAEVRSYSLGTRQKLGILIGLIGEPAMVVLDEPLNGLDPLSAYALKQHLVALTRDRGCAVLLATHALEVAERFINRAVLLVEGLLAREWAGAELDAIRHDPDNSLEQVMVEALRRQGDQRAA